MSGHVTDEKGDALMSVSVLLYADSLLTPPMVCYAVTQKDGSFYLSSDTIETGWLQAKCLGFEDYVSHVSGRQYGMKVVLKEDGRTLSEVIVKGTYTGIKVSGDTVKFDTEHFRNGFEGNVGELLDKLPGMSVSEDGMVSYGGKTISKLLVDGKDLFTKGNNGVIIKNMSAEIVDGAEIIQNYKGDDLSDKFAYNSKTALNIKTRGIDKTTGYADINGGYEERYNVKAFNLGMNDKFSITSVISGNNLGTPVFSVSDYFNRILGNEDLTSGSNKSINLFGMEAGLLYRPDNIYKDRSSVVSIDTKYNPSEKFTISGRCIFPYSATWRDVMMMPFRM